MRKNSCFFDHNQTLIIGDSLEETPRQFKYQTVWKRALRKIKTELLISRFMNIARTNPYIITPEILESYLQDSYHLSLTASKSFILYQHSKIYLTWLCILFISLVYLTTFGIFYSSFVGFSSNSVFNKLEMIIDLVYLLDIAVTMNLAVFDINNNIIVNRKEIIAEYAKGKLIVDLFTALPASIILNVRGDLHNTFLITFRHIPKLLKWVGISKQLKNFSLVKKIGHLIIRYKVFAQGFFISFKFVIALHIFACLLYLTSKFENFSEETWVYKSKLLDKSLEFQYITSLYFSLTSIATVGYGELHPGTTLERSLSLTWMAMGILIVSLSVSQFITLLNAILESDLNVTRNLTIVDDIATMVELKGLLKIRLMRFIKDEKIVKKNLNIWSVLQRLEPFLRFQVASNIYNKGIMKIPFFSMKTEEFLGYFTFLLEYVRYDKNEYIWHKNAHSDGIYFIIEGKVKFLYNKILFSVVFEGGFFGDFEVFLKTQRKFDVEVSDVCECFKMCLSTLKNLKENFPKYYYELKRMKKVRQENLLSGLAQMITIHKYRIGTERIICKNEVNINREQLIKEMIFGEIDDEKRRLNEAIETLKTIELHKKKVKVLINSLLLGKKPRHNIFSFQKNDIEHLEL